MNLDLVKLNGRDYSRTMGFSLLAAVKAVTLIAVRDRCATTIIAETFGNVIIIIIRFVFFRFRVLNGIMDRGSIIYMTILVDFIF